MFRIVLLGLFLFSHVAFAGRPKVIFVKGKALAKVEGLSIPRALLANQFLSESVLVQTDAKSFLKIGFEDEYSLVLGSKAMMSVVLNNRKSTVIVLRKGKIRVKELKENPKHRIFILTKNSIADLSRSDSLIAYNRENTNTLVTVFDGSVKFSHLKSKGVDNEEVVFDRDRRGELSMKSSKLKNSGFLAETTQKLRGRNAVEIEIGQFSVATDQLSHATIPVQYNPFQANLLANNETLVNKSSESFLIADTTEYKGKTRLELVVGKAPPEGFYYHGLDQYAPRAGGLIDLDTVFYMAPREGNSKYLGEYNVFYDESLGRLEKELGDYLPPEGLILTADKGFLASKDSKNIKKDVEQVRSLNESILRDVVLTKKIGEAKALSRLSSFNQKDLLNRYTLDFSIGHQMANWTPLGQVLTALLKETVKNLN